MNLMQGDVGAGCEEVGDALSASDHAWDHLKRVQLLSCGICNIENEGTGVSNSRGFKM